jgi:hypothetical protein
MWNPFSDAAQGAVKGFGEAIKDAVGAFKADPTKVVELEVSLQKARMEFESATMVAVNATMQAEAKSEHWMQWAWRPTFGFTGAAILVNNYILLPYFAKLGVVPIVVPAEVWMMIAAVLGVAAYVRGRDK